MYQTARTRKRWPRKRWHGIVGGVSTLAVLGALALTSTPAASASPDAGRDQAFGQAAKEFGVPESLLEALSYAQTRWDDHVGEHNTDGGYGPMNLIDGTLFAGDRGEAKNGDAAGAAPAKIDSLGRAAKLLGVDRQQLRTDPAANIRGGAALLAAEQRSLKLPVGASTSPGRWYAAVAASSGATEQSAAKTFADDVYAALADGAQRTTDDGQRVSMKAAKTEPQTGQLSLLGLKKSSNKSGIECPPGLDCESIPAPYEKYGPGAGDYGNYDKAPRDTPAGPTVDYIVLHDTEGSWDTTLKLVQDPTYLGWHYTIRSADGHIAQHIPTKDVGWHAGNWYINQHSIGIEQEGFAAQGATWYTESLYRNSARLVRYLAHKWQIPLDRAHILGHDNVPGIYADYVAGMHWDPGPYWDWQHYFHLLGAPLEARHGKPSKEIVRILPGFDNNQQPVTGCTTAGQPCDPQGTDFVYLHTEPNADSPLVKDIDLHTDGSASTTQVSDVGARAVAGQDFAVADRQGDWTAVWYLGQKGWFYNPRGDRTAKDVGGWLVKPKAGVDAVATYGRAYPEASAYPDPIPAQSILSLSYQLTAGQSAVLTDRTVSTDYYRAVTYDTPPPADHIDIRGQTKYLQISFGHRIMYVQAADVDIVRAR
ncbi:N-acetylmuramoyl-L-alanine amidase [Microlunatus elymi]|uniref:N-acetylmuramoyl-L-alanine amidase n=1 Tax=Microlunatus elymi TaxID=2596828 RepID=A0A516Q376_9ACTN|nr:peptidoglycan recognition family protein [Microlunatus elymi]QDP97884.1 N-acetylmuramoyl-L-alanine amidase [Microlunatus elymi]